MMRMKYIGFVHIANLFPKRGRISQHQVGRVEFPLSKATVGGGGAAKARWSWASSSQDDIEARDD